MVQDMPYCRVFLLHDNDLVLAQHIGEPLTWRNFEQSPLVHAYSRSERKNRKKEYILANLSVYSEGNLKETESRHWPLHCYSCFTKAVLKNLELRGRLQCSYYLPANCSTLKQAISWPVSNENQLKNFGAAGVFISSWRSWPSNCPQADLTTTCALGAITSGPLGSGIRPYPINDPSSLPSINATLRAMVWLYKDTTWKCWGKAKQSNSDQSCSPWNPGCRKPYSLSSFL